MRLDLQDPWLKWLQDKRGNLDHKDTLVLKDLLALLAIMAVLVGKVKWVQLAFLELLDS